MLSYQHGYHAGGPADLQKHLALSILLRKFLEKEKPFVVIDLYAGHGTYDLSDAAAAKTGEFAQGVGRLWPHRAAAPEAARLYVEILCKANATGVLKQYPGSPAIARAVLRPDDRLILNELHPKAFTELKQWAARDERISIHKRDGLEALVGLVPPPVRRGLVVIDPSYEIKTEYEDIPARLKVAMQKWPQGVYLIWYPLLPDGRQRTLIENVRREVPGNIFLCELILGAERRMDERTGLRGSGVVVVNPPWQFDVQMEEAGAWLTQALAAPPLDLRWLRQDGAS